MAHSENAKKFKELGNAAFSAKDYPTAIKHFSSAIEADPNDHVFYSNRSACYACLEQYDKALDDAKICVNLKPDWIRGYTRKGLAECYLKNYEEAKATYTKALEIEPDNSAILDSLKLTEEAETEYRTVHLQQILVFVKYDWPQKIAQMQVSKDALIKHIKWEMESSVGIPSNKQQYICKRFGTLFLGQNRTLASCEISDKDELKMVERWTANSIIKVQKPGKIARNIYLEDQACDTIDKIFYIFRVDPSEYDLFFDKINICNVDWDFNTAEKQGTYRFVRKMWLDRRKALFALKNRKIELPTSLQRELISFI